MLKIKKLKKSKDKVKYPSSLAYLDPYSLVTQIRKSEWKLHSTNKWKKSSHLIILLVEEVLSTSSESAFFIVKFSNTCL